MADRIEGSGVGNLFYGWFDDADQKRPTYDPPHVAPCPFCGKRIYQANNVKTHSLMYQTEYGPRTYFYRTHKACADQDPTHTAMDGFVLDMVKRNGD